jgi:hypothetical protein
MMGLVSGDVHVRTTVEVSRITPLGPLISGGVGTKVREKEEKGWDSGMVVQ